MKKSIFTVLCKSHRHTMYVHTHTSRRAPSMIFLTGLASCRRAPATRVQRAELVSSAQLALPGLRGSPWIRPERPLAPRARSTRRPKLFKPGPSSSSPRRREFDCKEIAAREPGLFPSNHTTLLQGLSGTLDLVFKASIPGGLAPTPGGALWACSGPPGPSCRGASPLWGLRYEGGAPLGNNIISISI